MKGARAESCNNHNAERMKNTLVSLVRALPLLLLSILAAPAALALDTGDILVVSAKGEVRVTMNGTVKPVRAGTVLELPASVSTGHDGSIELRQGATTISVGPETLLDFPALERRGGPIDRVQQPRGNAFYSIGKREGRKLRVETPYLVGVVKGTQFNVAAREEATTISLFEGLLEVRATDESAVVDLKAGEIASRRRGDTTISVIRMDSGKLPTTAPRPQANNDGSNGSGSNGNNGSNGSSGGPAGASPADRGNGHAGSSTEVVVAVSDPLNRPGLTGNVGADVRTPGAALSGDAGVSLANGNAAVNVATDATVGDAVSSNTGVAVSAGSDGAVADVSTSTSVNAGPVGVDLAAAANVGVTPGAITAEISTGANVGVGPVAADLSTSTGVDVAATGLSVENSTDAAVSAGPLTVDTSAATAVDVGNSGVTADITTSTAVDSGPVAVDLGTTAAVDVSTGSIAVDTPATVDVAGTDVSAGVSAGVDLSSGTVDLGVSVAGTDLGLGVDLGLGNNEPATDTGSSTTPATDTGNTGTIDVGGLLDGLLRRPGRR
jgi:hypothetical protein